MTSREETIQGWYPYSIQGELTDQHITSHDQSVKGITVTTLTTTSTVKTSTTITSTSSYSTPTPVATSTSSNIVLFGQTIPTWVPLTVVGVLAGLCCISFVCACRRCLRFVCCFGSPSRHRSGARTRRGCIGSDTDSSLLERPSFFDSPALKRTADVENYLASINAQTQAPAINHIHSHPLSVSTQSMRKSMVVSKSGTKTLVRDLEAASNPVNRTIMLSTGQLAALQSKSKSGSKQLSPSISMTYSTSIHGSRSASPYLSPMSRSKNSLNPSSTFNASDQSGKISIKQ